MSIANARSAAYTLITTCGPWSTCEVSGCDFGIVPQLSVSGIVFHPDGDSNIEEITFAGNSPRGSQYVTWAFRGNGFIKFDGNSPCFVARTYQMIDDIFTTFSKSWEGATQNAASKLTLNRINYNIDTVYEIGGLDFGLIQFYFTEEEIDSS